MWMSVMSPPFRPRKARAVHSSAFCVRQRLNAPHRLVEANQPYQISDDGDYTIPVHGEARGIEAVLFEVRQDLIASPEGQKAWASLIAQALD